MDSTIHSQVAEMQHGATTTGFDCLVFKSCTAWGVVRGVVLRSRSLFATIGAGFQTHFG